MRNGISGVRRLIRHQKRCSRIIQSEKSLEDELPKSLVDDIVNIGIGIPEMVSRYARKSGMLDMVTLTVESGGIGGFPVSGEAFGAMIGAASVYDMANQFDLYDNGGLDICFMGALEVDQYGNINAHRGPGAFAGIGGFANITAKTPTVVFCMSFNAKGLTVSQKKW